MENTNVDNTQELRTVEWFFGYGGNHLGLRNCLPGLRFLAVYERDAFVVANMVSKMEAGLLDPVPIWTDATTFPIEPFKDRVGLFIASYPCQPFSHAGKRDGQNDDRHLWPSCRRFICGAHPAMVFLENVEGHVSLGLSIVLSDLKKMVIQRRGEYSARLKSARLTSGSGSLSWPTTIVGDAHLCSSPEAAQRRIVEGKTTLCRLVESGMAEKMWPTICAQEGKANRTRPGGEIKGTQEWLTTVVLKGESGPPPRQAQYAWEPPRVWNK